MQKRGKLVFLSLSQIFILVLATFSFAYMINQINQVSAQPRGFSPFSTAIQPVNTNHVAGEETQRADAIRQSGGNPPSGGGGPTPTIPPPAPPPPAPPATPYEYSDPLGIISATGPWAHLYEGAVWSIMITGAIQTFGPMLGLDNEEVNAVNIAAVAGIMSYKGILALGPTGTGALGQGSFLVQNAPLIGLGVAAVVFIVLYKKESKKVVDFQCLPWEAPLGGSDCEACNGDPLMPCTEYRCKSLGQACDLVNKGTTEENCVWVARDDTNSPKITPWNEPLTDNHRYTNHDQLPISQGAKIVREDAANGCLQAFTPLEFGILLDEPGQCRIDYIHTDGFEEMQFLVGESNFYRYNHTQKMSLPSPESLQNASPEIESDGQYDLYVRCRDANGNENVQEYALQFCVDPSPDVTPPVIVDTSIESGSHVNFGADSVTVSAFINEPAECKWSVQDKHYDEMENAMSCSTEVYQQNAEQLYPCTANLTGIEDRQSNNFYFRCKDKPWAGENDRNVNTESYEFTLRGSQPLNIISAEPNGTTITGSTTSVNFNLEVETSNGAEEGKAACYFSPTGEEGSFIAMFETASHMHSQLLVLPQGDYNYHLRCVDVGGNSDESEVEFSVFVDTEAPMITRAYRDIDALKIVTDEPSECVYSLNNCNYAFDEGIKMLRSSDSIHLTEWKPNLVHYIKCRDDFGNEPNPNECSIIASATNIK